MFDEFEKIFVPTTKRISKVLKENEMFGNQYDIMSSKLYDPSFEDIIVGFEQAQEYLKQKRFQEALNALEKSGIKSHSYFQIYLLSSECAYALHDYPKAVEYMNQAIECQSLDEEKSKENLLEKIKLLMFRSRIFYQLNKKESCEDDLEAALKIIQFDLAEILKDDKKVLKRVKRSFRKHLEFIENEKNAIVDLSITNRDQQAAVVLKLMEVSEKKNMLSTNFGVVHIVSMKWFDQWKRYTGFEKVRTGKQKQLAEEDGSENTYPGPISSDDIIDKSEEGLVDPEPQEEYCNYPIRRGLVENRDFMILSHLVWRYLYSIYSGQDIKRYVLSKDGSKSSATVEIWLKKVNIFTYPLPERKGDVSKAKVQPVYVSKRETVGDLSNKIIRIHQNMYKNCQSCIRTIGYHLIKLDPQEDFKQLCKKLKENETKIPIEGRVLQDDVVLEDAEIADNDIVICEYKTEQDSPFALKGQQEEGNVARPAPPSSNSNSKICSYCSKQNDKLLACVCKAARYCDEACQKSHRKEHKSVCETIRAPEIKANNIMKEFHVSQSKFAPNSRHGLVGLQNLGNTCFMNSSLQCLSNLPELTYYFLENQFVSHLNKENKLGTGGKCAAAYGELMKQLWHGTSSSVSPWEVKKMLSVLAHQFEGFSQQDAQEFMAYLLDGIHEDLDRVTNKPYIETLDGEGKEDALVAGESWQNHLKRNQSMIVDLMHGQYKSQVTCPDCGKSPITFDPFLMVTLPVPFFASIAFPLYFVYKNSEALTAKINLVLLPNMRASEVIEEISKLVKIPADCISLKLNDENFLVDVDIEEHTAKTLKEADGSIFAHEIYNSELDGVKSVYMKQKKARIEVQIYNRVGKKGEVEHTSFSRLLLLPEQTSLRDLKIQTYTLLRNYLHNFFKIEDASRYFFEIDPSKTDLETIEAEYNTMLKVASENNKGLPYEVMFKVGKKKKGSSQPLPEEDDLKIEDIAKGASKFNLEVIIASSITTDYMKLSRCKAFGETNKAAKEPNSYNLYDCFDLFAKPEVLDKENLWYCPKCKDHKQATKKMDIYRVPKYLIIHLKRFKTNKVHSIGSYYFSGGSQKITTNIDFPLEDLDLSKYAIGTSDKAPIYDLVGVVNHYGSLSGGHYTAFCKNSEKKAWYEFDDSSVSKQDPKGVVSEAAYILFYKQKD